jgi:diguanylate cyclase (GGDEF)-like protein/PAS domain S-box-containing protein
MATKVHRRRWGVALLLLCAALSLVTSARPGAASTWVAGAAQNALTLAFLVVSLRNLVTDRGGQWWCITAYAAGFAIAQAGWSANGLVSGPTSLGIWPDRVYGVALPLGVVGLVWLAFDGLRRVEAFRVLTDAAVVASGLAVAWWVGLFELTGLSTHVAGRGGALLYPFLDVVAGAVIITAAIYQPHRPNLSWLALVVPIAAVGDSISALQPDPHEMGRWLAGALAVTWIVAPAVLVLAVSTEDGGSRSFPLNRHRRSRLAWFIGLGLAALVAEAVARHRLDGPAMWLALALAAATVVNHVSVFRELRTVVAAHADALSALGASEEGFRLTFEGAPVGIALFEDGVMRAANPTAHRMLGIEEHTGRLAREWVGFDVIPHFPSDQWVRVSDTIETVHHEFRWTRPDGVEAWMHLSLARNPYSDDNRTIATVEDVTERKAVTDRLAHLAVHDALTGLPNRVAFTGQLEAALESGGRAVAMAFLDVDRFKVINDSVGHQVGDRVLQAVAQRIVAAAGEGATIARFAGDEFTILLQDRDRSEVVAILERVRTALGEPLALAGGIETYPTASIGVAFSAPGDAAADLLARADAAMYRAKERGRNTWEVYDDADELGAQAELRLVGEMHRALEREEFRLHYQPVVDARTSRVVGYEALIRWQHPQRGLLAPGEFIEAAEASGLIVPIGEWVAREALGQLATWQRARPGLGITMAVNVAARQISESFPERIASILEDTGVAADLVWLELTESALMFNRRNADSVLGRLRDLGVHVSVDDFGTGYSSLTYLQRLPIEGIKLDQTFVAGLGERERDGAICHAVLSLGTALGLRTVAEGVETELQRQRLLAMGCEQAQGYLFGRPAPPAEIVYGELTTADRDRAGSASSTSGPTTASATR